MGAMQFVVYGQPVQQGSTKAYIAGGHANTVHENSDALKQWRYEIGKAADEARGGRPLPRGAIEVVLYFWHRRKQSDFRKDGTLKASARRYPIVAPDIDKLVRAALDGLTNKGFVDDKQVVTLQVRDRYRHNRDGRPGLECAVITLDPEEGW